MAVFSQAIITLDSIVTEPNGKLTGYFKTDSTQGLHIWSWNGTQLVATPGERLRIKGYTKNFDILTDSTFRTRPGYNAITCGVPWCVWATFTQPFGHRPPVYLDQVVNGLMIEEPCPQERSGPATRTLVQVGSTAWRTVVNVQSCTDTLVVDLVNGEFSMTYDLDDDYGAYTFMIGGGSVWNAQDKTIVHVYKVSGQVATNIVVNTGGYYVSSSATETKLMRPSTNVFRANVYAWKTNPNCPSPILHWKDGQYQ